MRFKESGKFKSPGELHVGDVLAVNLGRMTIATACHFQEKFAALGSIRKYRSRHRLGDWLRRAQNQAVERECDVALWKGIPHSRNAAQVDDNGREILIRKSLEIRVRHDWE